MYVCIINRDDLVVDRFMYEHNPVMFWSWKYGQHCFTTTKWDYSFPGEQICFEHLRTNNFMGISYSDLMGNIVNSIFLSMTENGGYPNVWPFYGNLGKFRCFRSGFTLKVASNVEDAMAILQNLEPNHPSRFSQLCLLGLGVVRWMGNPES